MRPLIALALAVACAGAQAQTEIVLDNIAPVFATTGTWPASTSVSGYIGTNYQVHAGGSGSNVFTWTLNAPAAGTYEVYARWTQHPNRATDAKYTVNHAGGASTVTANQEQNSGAWKSTVSVQAEPKL